MREEKEVERCQVWIIRFYQVQEYRYVAPSSGLAAGTVRLECMAGEA